jgi:hypothetical protein
LARPGTLVVERMLRSAGAPGGRSGREDGARYTGSEPVSAVTAVPGRPPLKSPALDARDDQVGGRSLADAAFDSIDTKIVLNGRGNRVDVQWHWLRSAAAIPSVAALGRRSTGQQSDGLSCKLEGEKCNKRGRLIW